MNIRSWRTWLGLGASNAHGIATPTRLGQRAGGAIRRAVREWVDLMRNEARTPAHFEAQPVEVAACIGFLDPTWASELLADIRKNAPTGLVTPRRFDEARALWSDAASRPPLHDASNTAIRALLEKALCTSRLSWGPSLPEQMQSLLTSCTNQLSELTASHSWRQLPWQPAVALAENQPAPLTPNLLVRGVELLYCLEIAMTFVRSNEADTERIKWQCAQVVARMSGDMARQHQHFLSGWAHLAQRIQGSDLQRLQFDRLSVENDAEYLRRAWSLGQDSFSA